MSAESVQIGDGLSHLNDGALQQVLAEPAGLAEQQVGAEACPDSGGVAYQSVAFPSKDFLVWNQTVNMKAEASWTVVMAGSSWSCDNIFSWPNVTYGAMHWISFLINERYSIENWVLEKFRKCIPVFVY